MKSNNGAKKISLLAMLFGVSYLQGGGPEVKSLTHIEEEAQQAPVPGEKKSTLYTAKHGDTCLSLKLKNNTESLFSKNTELFSGHDNDRLFYSKSTWNLGVDAECGNLVKGKLVLRSKATWGNESSVASTATSSIKLGDGNVGDHKHSLAKQVFWLKEGWVDFSLTKALNLCTERQHRVKLGSFSFELGRGIALGDGYATSRGIIGFYSSDVVDQYAFGALLYGEPCTRWNIGYNLYGAILENKSDKFSRVNEASRASEIGQRNTPQRGFGQVNFVLAANAKWKALDSSDHGVLDVEPYVLFNRAPEQNVAFNDDASSKLVTLGVAAEYAHDRFECGAELAGNYGTQKVKGWDRNVVETVRSSSGVLQQVYSHVKTGSATGSKAAVSDANKLVVDASNKGASYNSALIDGSLYNDANRFRSAYENKYKGVMFVADASYSFLDGDLKVAGTVAVATGDEDPNVNLENPKASSVDGDFKGFIGLQEIYSGKRVKSLFVIGDHNFARPLSVPNNGYSTTVNGFTNLVYFGGGVDYKAQLMSKDWKFAGGVLSYWQQHATKKFDATTKLSTDEFARKHLGVELNVSANVALMDHVSSFVVGGVFVPGAHYDDIKGTPLNSTQLKALDHIDETGFNDNGVPTLSNKTSFVLSWGVNVEF